MSREKGFGNWGHISATITYIPHDVKISYQYNIRSGTVFSKDKEEDSYFPSENYKDLFVSLGLFYIIRLL